MLAFDIDKFPSAKLKLEQYFLEWLLLEGNVFKIFSIASLPL